MRQIRMFRKKIKKQNFLRAVVPTLFTLLQYKKADSKRPGTANERKCMKSSHTE